MVKPSPWPIQGSLRIVCFSIPHRNPRDRLLWDSYPYITAEGLWCGKAKELRPDYATDREAVFEPGFLCPGSACGFTDVYCLPNTHRGSRW